MAKVNTGLRDNREAERDNREERMEKPSVSNCSLCDSFAFVVEFPDYNYPVSATALPQSSAPVEGLSQVREIEG